MYVFVNCNVCEESCEEEDFLVVDEILSFPPSLMSILGEFKGKTEGRQRNGGVFLQQLEKEINKIPVTSLNLHPIPELQVYYFKEIFEKYHILCCKVTFQQLTGGVFSGDSSS